MGRILSKTWTFVTVLALAHSLSAQTTLPPDPNTAAGALVISDTEDPNSQTIDAHFTDVEITTLLRLLARQSGQSIIIDSEITGTVSIDFQQAPYQEALESVLHIGELEMTCQGEVLVVRPKQKHEVVSYFTLQNNNVSTLLDSLSQLFGEKASLQADINTNSLLIAAPAHLSQAIERTVAELDRPKKQVMVEAAIIEVSLDDKTTVGIDWATLLQKTDYALSLETAGFAADPSLLEDPTGLFGESNFLVGKSDYTVDVMIEALQSVTDSKVLSHPKIIGINNEAAELIVGKKLGFRVTTTTETGTLESVEFLEVGTQLKFTPQITDSEQIVMSIHPEVSDGTISEDGLPNETTTEITTQVRVTNGQTIILGGLIRERLEVITEQVPLLGDLPVIGPLFRRNTDTIIRSEILVLMNPRIIQDHELPTHTQQDIKRMKQLYQQGIHDPLLQESTLSRKNSPETAFPLFDESNP